MKKHARAISIVLIIAISLILLTACSSVKDNPAQAIEAYIQALSEKDSVQLTNLSCSNWEANALIEVDSITAVGSKVEDLTCKQVGQDGDNIYVSCTGVLALDYNGEAQQIDLSARTYIARQEDGEWRMCGYR